MSLKYKGVQGWAKGGECSAGFCTAMRACRFFDILARGFITLAGLRSWFADGAATKDLGLTKIVEQGKRQNSRWDLLIVMKLFTKLNCSVLASPRESNCFRLGKPNFFVSSKE